MYTTRLLSPTPPFQLGGGPTVKTLWNQRHREAQGGFIDKAKGPKLPSNEGVHMTLNFLEQDEAMRHEDSWSVWLWGLLVHKPLGALAC